MPSLDIGMLYWTEKQAKDNIQHLMGKFRWLWLPFTSKWQEMSSKRDQTEFSEVSTILQMMCWWMKKPKFPMTKHYHSVRNCKSKQHHLQPWQVCLQVQGSQVLQWKPDPKGIQHWLQEGVSHHRNKTTTESSRSSELPGASQLPKLIQLKVNRADITTENSQQKGHS